MKKIYLSLITVMAALGATAQLSLTKAFNEPVASDIQSVKYYDSVGVVPKSTGSNQNWDFGPFVQTTVNVISTYSNAGSVPSASNYPGSTLVEFKGGDKTYWRSVASPTNEFHLLGLDLASGVSLSYTNPGIAAVWPINMGYVQVDPISGTISAMTQTGTLTGSLTTTGSGTGSLVLPGNFPVYNILQVKTQQLIYISLPGASYNATIVGTDYSYYSGSQKFPLITASYEREVQQVVTPTITITNIIKVNNAVLTGLNEKNFDASFQIFPNPAKDAFHVNLENMNGAAGRIEIYNAVGKVVKQLDLGEGTIIDTQVPISDLQSGVYLVKTSLGTRSSTRKLIIE